MLKISIDIWYYMFTILLNAEKKGEMFYDGFICGDYVLKLNNGRAKNPCCFILCVMDTLFLLCLTK